MKNNYNYLQSSGIDREFGIVFLSLEWRDMEANGGPGLRLWCIAMDGDGLIGMMSLMEF